MVETRQPVRMVYFVGEGVFSPVLDSQVVVPLRLLKEHAPNVRRSLLVLTSIRHRKNPKMPSRLDAIRAGLLPRMAAR